jgi:hypothetical protein
MKRQANKTNCQLIHRCGQDAFRRESSAIFRNRHNFPRTNSLCMPIRAGILATNWSADRGIGSLIAAALKLAKNNVEAVFEGLL